MFPVFLGLTPQAMNMSRLRRSQSMSITDHKPRSGERRVAPGVSPGNPGPLKNPALTGRQTIGVSFGTPSIAGRSRKLVRYAG
jgi:hypothetical protein